MLLDIITLPNKNLRQVSETIKKPDIESPVMQKFFDDLSETMLKKDGIGLAAIQVDKPWRVFSVATEKGPQIFINPQIIKKSLKKQLDEEGCLSIPQVYGTVKRSQKITVRAIDRNGEEFILKASGLFARVIQHENDHLNGILFIDKTKKITSGQEIFEKLQQ